MLQVLQGASVSYRHIFSFNLCFMIYMLTNVSDTFMRLFVVTNAYFNTVLILIYLATSLAQYLSIL